MIRSAMTPQDTVISSSQATTTSPAAMAAELTQASTPRRCAGDVDQGAIDDDLIFAEFETANNTEMFQSTLDEEVKDDESAVIRRSVQLGQAIMHVGPLDPNWKVQPRFSDIDQPINMTN